MSNWCTQPGGECAALTHCGRIADFQSAYPGARVVRTTDVDEHNGIGRYGWAIIDASGGTLVEGLDVTEEDPQGRLRRVLLFHGQLAYLG